LRQAISAAFRPSSADSAPPTRPSDRAGRKPDARTARAPVAAAHEPDERRRLEAVALDLAVDDDLSVLIKIIGE
jgi:hypothetical protein